MSFIDTLRGPKIYDMAIFDWVATIAVVYYLHGTFAKRSNIKPGSTESIVYFMTLLLSVIIFAVASHVYFNVDSKFNYYLGYGKDPRPEYDGSFYYSTNKPETNNNKK